MNSRKPGKETELSALSGRFLHDHLRLAAPAHANERIAIDILGTTPTTLSRWLHARQPVSAQKGHRLSIIRVLSAAGVIDAKQAREFWTAYDHLWALDHDEQPASPPGMARPYLAARDGAAPAATEPAEGAPRALPLFLPAEPLRMHHFSARALPLLGRQSALDALHGFLGTAKPVVWMQVAGSGGQGKSRLGLELALEAKDRGWDAGFIGPDTLRRFLDAHPDWQPPKPTLIVIDYIIGFEAELGDALRDIAARRRTNSVRVLILERQRWDKGFNLSGATADGLVGGKSAATGVADWFVRLTRSYEARHATIDALRDEQSVIELTALQPDELVRIVRLWTELQAATIAAQDDEIANWLLRIDPSGRPLYAYFLAEALIAGFAADGWTREDLLELTLTRDQIHRWSSSFGNQPPALGDDHPALKLAVLTTFVGELDVAILPQSTGWTYPSATVRKQAMVLLDGPVGVSVKGPGDTLFKLEPDILGGWFLLESARQWSATIESIAHAAWTIAPRATAATILRLGQDFPAHPALGAILAAPPPSNDAERAYSEIASGLLIALRGQIQKYRIQILPRIEAAALEGDRDAMARLGLCYQDGIGVDEPDLAAAHCWFLEGARLGDGRSMAYLGHWYFSGRDGAPDHAKALEWFQKGADAGDGHAMGYVGVCHHNGIGTAKDMPLAIRWFRRGSEAGDGQSAVYLGYCHLEGMGVEQDDSEAFRCFQLAADLGSGHALAYLGQMHLEGRGTPVDLTRAVQCFRDGVAAGSAAAIAYLGYCYREGAGVDRDVDEAVALLERGVRGRSGYAMFLLGECYDLGSGVEQDATRALELWHEAVRLGDIKAKRKLAEVGELDFP